jgi:hypothetical protein
LRPIGFRASTEIPADAESYRLLDTSPVPETTDSDAHETSRRRRAKWVFNYFKENEMKPIILALTLALFGSGISFADGSKVALGGYCPVAYVSAQKASIEKYVKRKHLPLNRPFVSDVRATHRTNKEMSEKEILRSRASLPLLDDQNF